MWPSRRHAEAFFDSIGHLRHFRLCGWKSALAPIVLHGAVRAVPHRRLYQPGWLHLIDRNTSHLIVSLWLPHRPRVLQRPDAFSMNYLLFGTLAGGSVVFGDGDTLVFFVEGALTVLLE
jgi:hypothetical protein